MKRSRKQCETALAPVQAPPPGRPCLANLRSEIRWYASVLGVKPGCRTSFGYWWQECERRGVQPQWEPHPVFERTWCPGLYWRESKKRPAHISISAELTKAEATSVLVHELAHHVSRGMLSFYEMTESSASRAEDRYEAIAVGVELAFLQAGGTGLRDEAELHTLLGTYAGCAPKRPWSRAKRAGWREWIAAGGVMTGQDSEPFGRDEDVYE